MRYTIYLPPDNIPLASFWVNDPEEEKEYYTFRKILMRTYKKLIIEITCEDESEDDD